MGDHQHTLVFRINDHGQGPELIKQVFLERGWLEFDEDEQEDHDWNLWWRTSRFRTGDHDQLMPWQRLNHYPKSTAITKKDSLARNMKRMKSVHGATYNFSPTAFNLPNDYTKFVSEYTHSKDKGIYYWICKPADLSRGRGIFIFKDLSELQYDCSAVVQQYIPNPLLISGYKFDLRIYVLVSSFNPLNIHIYNEGLVRFSTEKYDLSSLKNVYSHLTNTSINKNSPSYSTDKERIGQGCKWTLTQFRYYVHQIGVDDTTLFGKIINIIILTVLIQSQQVPKVLNCFELYGFDIIIDSNWKPWLLEVNFSPAMSYDCQTDIFVKKPMLHDLCEILRFSEQDKERGGEEYQMQRSQAIHLNNTLYPSYIPPTGRVSRRSSLAGGVGNHKPPLNKQNSTQKLPTISKQGNSTLLGATPRSVNSVTSQDQDEETVLDHKPPPSPDHTVFKLIPGCGLPSVQQPYNMIDSVVQDSGHTSPDSLCGEEEHISLDGIGIMDKKFGPQRERSFVLAKSGKMQRHLNEYKSDSECLESEPSNSDYKKHSNIFLQTKQYITSKRSYNQTSKTKHTSKISVTSDSGISSHSGSSYSDTSHAPTRQTHTKQHASQVTSIKNMSYSHKSLESSSKKLNHINYKDGANDKLDEFQSEVKNESLDNKAIASITSMVNSKYQSRAMNDAGTMKENLISVGSQVYKYGSNRKGERLSRLSRDFRNPRKNQLSFNSSSHVQAQNRVPAVRSRSQISNPQSQNQILTPRSNRDQRSRPWRKTKSNQENERPTTPKISPYNPEKVVGGFYLVFPFNDVTKRCAQGSLDTKTVIKECQKKLKERITRSQVNKQKLASATNDSNPTEENRKSNSAHSQRHIGSSHVSQCVEKSTLSNHSYETKTYSDVPIPSRGDTTSAKSNSRSSVPNSRTSSKTRLTSNSVNYTRSSPSLNNGGSTKNEASTSKGASPSFHTNQFIQEPQELWGPLKHVPKEASF